MQKYRDTTNLGSDRGVVGIQCNTWTPRFLVSTLKGDIT